MDEEAGLIGLGVYFISCNIYMDEIKQIIRLIYGLKEGNGCVRNQQESLINNTDIFGAIGHAES